VCNCSELKKGRLLQ